MPIAAVLEFARGHLRAVEPARCHRCLRSVFNRTTRTSCSLGYAGYQYKSPITLSLQDAPPCGVASWSLWFRLTLLFASLTSMATTIIAEERARCGVVGMIE